MFEPVKPNLEKIAADIATKYEMSYFTDQLWLEKTILAEFISIWEMSKRAEANRIEKICKEKGWIK